MSIPVRLSLKDRHVYIIGAGAVAYRKYQIYKQEGARISIIGLQLHKKFASEEAFTYIQQPFSWKLIEQDAFLIYAASDDLVLNQEIIKEAKKRQILCGCANQGMDCDVQSMAVWEGEFMQVAISTKGNCPGADRAFLKQLSTQIEGFDQRTKQLGHLRKQLLSQSIDAQILRSVLSKAASLSSLYLADILAGMEGKRVLLLAYHGIAKVGSIQSLLMKVKQECEARFTNCVAIPVFLSEKIVTKAKKKGYEIEQIQTITHVLDILHITYQIQPVLLNTGHWYEEVHSLYPHHVLGKPLCENQADVKRVLAAIHNDIPEGFLLGLYHPSDGSLFETCSQEETTMVRSMESVSFPHSITAPLHVFACCIFCGYHVEKDILQRWLPYLQEHHEQVQIHKEGLLAYAQCRELLYEKIEDVFHL